ncbi:MAG: hypothetical protein J0I06_23580 [Planctomycetes bacterium]|nr:hypothetical protein [Planctomycetota bacterium]
MRGTTSRRAAAGALLTVLLAAVGCGSGDGVNRGGKLAGKVTLDGKPVGGGEVIVASADGKHSMSGKIRNNGSYTILDPPLGACKLAVITSPLKDVPPPSAKKGPVNFTDPATGEWPIYVKIPAKYEKAETSGLTVDVKAGDQPHDIPLTEKP